MDEVKARIYVPSYHRSNAIKTYHLLEECTYVVRKSEEEAYLKAGIKKKDLWAVDDELINGGDVVVWYIIENAPEDLICICDDDFDDFKYMIDYSWEIGKDKEIITAEIERQLQLISDLGIGLGFLTPTCIPYNYDKEFGFKGIVGAVKFINRKVFKAKYDPLVAENFDIDMTLQELLHNRIVLVPKYFYDKSRMDVNAGGNSERRRQDQIDSVMNMKAKWGQYFDYNWDKNKPNIKVRR
jgi:hypothetical protein